MPRVNAGRAVRVRKDKDGDITHIKFQNRNRFTPLSQAINLYLDGLTKGLRLNQTANGRQYLQGVPDGDGDNNLDNLPLG